MSKENAYARINELAVCMTSASAFLFSYDPKVISAIQDIITGEMLSKNPTRNREAIYKQFQSEEGQKALILLRETVDLLIEELD